MKTVWMLVGAAVLVGGMALQFGQRSPDVYGGGSGVSLTPVQLRTVEGLPRSAAE